MTGGEADLEAELEQQVEQGDGQEEAREQCFVETTVGVLTRWTSG